MLLCTAVLAAESSAQFMLVDTFNNSKALQMAASLLENERALAREDFQLVTSTAPTVNENFRTQIDVELMPDFVTKKVIATVLWQSQSRNLSTSLTTLITDPQDPKGMDTCDATPNGDWTSPKIENTVTDFAQLVGDPSGIYPITGIDVYQGKMYVAINNSSLNIKSTFFIFDVQDPAAPQLLGQLDNAVGISAGLNAVTTDGHYAYVANGYDANFQTCSQSSHCAQLQIIDVGNPASPSVVTNYKLPSSGPPFVLGNVGSGNGQAVGKSIFYKNGYVFLGLSTTASGPGFHIIDVHDPLHPSWVGSFPAAAASLGSSQSPVNAIVVKGFSAFLAHPANFTGTPAEQLTILNVDDVANPVRANGFFSSSGIGGNGKSLSVVGNTVYLGRTASNISGQADAIPEFFALDSSTTPPATLTSSALSTTGDSINGFKVRRQLVFLLTNTKFMIWSVDQSTNPWTIVSHATLSLPGASAGSALECEGNILYVGSSDASHHGYVSIIGVP